MILFTALLIVLLIVGVGGALTLLCGGVSFLLTFGDVIICVALIILIIRHFIKKHKNENGN